MSVIWKEPAILGIYIKDHEGDTGVYITSSIFLLLWCLANDIITNSASLKCCKKNHPFILGGIYICVLVFWSKACLLIIFFQFNKD